MTPATGSNTVPLGARQQAAACGAEADRAVRTASQSAAPAGSAAPAAPGPKAKQAATQQRGTPAVAAATGQLAAGAVQPAGEATAGGCVTADAQADRQQAAAVRAKEHKRLARLDAALETLDAEDGEAAEALRRARRQCAERIAGTQPLGRRLADAKKAHARASAELAAAEEAAAAAAHRAEQALEAEHAWAVKVEDLQRQVDGMQSRQPAEPALATARAFMTEMHEWLSGLGMSPPQAVQEAADRLRSCLPDDSQGDAYTPTDLVAPLTPAQEAEGGETWEAERPAAAADASMEATSKREADDQVHGPALRPRRERTEPYARAASR